MALKNLFLPFSFVLALSIQHELHAQSIYDDAKILSLDELNGTARFKGLGGVNTALGGDISSISGNPAGLGFFGQSDASISFNMLNNSNKVNYFGQQTNRNHSTFGLENAGIVLQFPTAYDENIGWQNFNIGVSINRQNNYNDKVVYNGINDQNTVVHYLTDVMYDSPSFASDFKNSFLVEQFANPSEGYFPTVLEADPKGQQIQNIAGGYKYLTNFAVGANYSHKFYIGAGVGLLSYKNTYDSQISERGWTKRGDEIAADKPNTDFAKPGTLANKYTDINYSITDRMLSESSGYGANFSFGMIFKPTWDWNIGVNFVSPTWTTVTYDDYIDNEVRYFKDEDSNTDLHPSYTSGPRGMSSDYSIISPWKAAVGLTKFFGRGLISADAEFVDYGSIKYVDESTSGASSDESAINNDLKSIYKGSFNLRVGAEYVITDQLTGRAGFNYRASPYKDSDKGSSIASLGLGYIFPNAMYLDLTAMQYQSVTYYNSPYTLSEVWDSPNPEAEIKNSRTNVVLTMGIKF